MCHKTDVNLQQVVKRLLDSGADVNIKDMHGEVALHLAAAKKHVGIIQLLFQVMLLLVLLNLDMPCLCKQCRFRSVGF